MGAILSLERADLDTSRAFDDYGLDSIDAVLASGLLSEKLEIELAPEFLLRNRTLDDVLSALMRAPFASAAELASAGPSTASTFVFPGGGDDFRFSKLYKHFPDSLVFEHMSFGSWREWIQLRLGVSDLSRKASDEVEARCPSGPLRLAGYSQGGQLAFATTLELTRRGREVEVLSLFDSPAHAREIESLSWIARLRWLAKSALRVASAVWRLIWRRLGRPATKAGSRRRSGDTRVRVVMGWLDHFSMRGGSRRLAGGLAAWGRVLFVGRGGVRLNRALQMRIFSDMWSDWCAQSTFGQPHSVRTVLFKSTDPGLHDLGWSDRCTSVEVRLVQGGHHSMFDIENLPSLAEHYLASSAFERPRSREPAADAPLS